MTTLRVAASSLLALMVATSFGRLGAQDVTDQRMAADAHPAFATASIEVSEGGDRSGFHTRGRSLFIENETVMNLICFAYGVDMRQIVDAPRWFAERYDVTGVPNVPGEPGMAQEREMVGKLLEDRFHLQFHRVQRTMPRYTLRVAKGGAKIDATQSKPDDSMPDRMQSIDGQAVRWSFANNSMTDFAVFLESVLLHPVVDQTGLKGRFDFRLTWPMEALNALDSPRPGAEEDFVRAIQEQAGLKVERSVGKVDVLEIVHAEQPSPN